MQTGASTKSLDEEESKMARYDFILRDGWFVFELPWVPPQAAESPLQYMQGLADEGESIRLALDTALFTLIARYLITGLTPPRVEIAPADWLPLVRACDYLGLSHLPAALTDNADIAFLSALTYEDARMVLRERRLIEIYESVKMPEPDMAPELVDLPEPADLAIATLLDDKFRSHSCAIGACTGMCGAPSLVDEINRVRPGDLIRLLTTDYNENWADVERALGRAQYTSISGNKQVRWRSTMMLDGLEDFPWVAEGARSGARVVLAGAAMLYALTNVPPHRLQRLYGARKYDLYLVTQSPDDAMEALIRIGAWISRKTGSQFMIARTESAIQFMTGFGVFTLSTELYSSVEHVLCTLSTAPVAYDGTGAFVAERGDRELRLQRVIADPSRHTTMRLAQMLARGFDVAIPGLGPRATIDLGHMQARQARHTCVDISRTVVEQLYASAKIGFHRVTSDYNQIECLPYNISLEMTHATTLQRYVEVVQRRIASGAYRPVVFSRNLAYIVHSCDADLVPKRPSGAPCNPDLAYVPPGSKASRLVFTRKLYLPVSRTATGWFPDEILADARINARINARTVHA